MTAEYTRGTVVKGPDLLGGHDHRPYVRTSDDSHPFHYEEALYAAVTTTRRPDAIPLGDDDFASGGLPRKSHVNPWTVVVIRHADVEEEEGRLVGATTERIAEDAAGYLGVR